MDAHRAAFDRITARAKEAGILRKAYPEAGIAIIVIPDPRALAAPISGTDLSTANPTPVGEPAAPAAGH